MRMAGIYIQRDKRRFRVAKQAQPDVGRKRNRKEGAREREKKKRSCCLYGNAYTTIDSI